MQGGSEVIGRGTARFFGVIAAAALAGLAGQAWGQPAEQKPVLQGPPVDSRQVPGVEPRFGEPMERARDMRRELPPRVFQDALNGLRGEAAPEEVRLTPEQETEIDGLLEEYRGAMRAHVQQRRGELGEEDRQKLRRALRERRQGDREPGPEGEGRPMAPEGGEPGEGRARMDELRRGMPRFSDWQVKIWAELTEPQRAIVEGKLAEARERMEERQGREYLERRMRQRQGAGQAGPRPRTDRPPEGGAATPERLRRLAARLQELPPEEQDRILRRLEDELDRRSRLREGRPPVDDRPATAPADPGRRRPRGPQ